MRNDHLGSSLSIVTIKFNLELIELLLSKKADPSISDDHGNTPLHCIFALFSTNIPIAKKITLLLLSAGSNANC